MAFKRKNIFQRLKYPRAVKRRKIELTKTCLESLPIESYNSIVKLGESRSRLRKVTCTRAKISNYHILETESTGKDIFCKIISTNIKLKKSDKDIEKSINFTNIIPMVSPILEKFKKQHKMFKYRDELKYIMDKAEKKTRQKRAKQKYKGQIHIYLLKSFFGFVLYKNVPLKLFGTGKNFKAVKKSIYCLLKTHPKKIPIKSSLAINRKETFKTAFTGLLNIKPLLKKLDISKIEWLQPLKNIKHKWIVILKLLHWFFAQYIIKILHKYIVLIASKQQWLYIMKDDWCQMQRTFINEKMNRGDFLLDQPESGNEIYNKIYVNQLTASSSGLRVIAKCNSEKKSFEIEIILRFLQQLYCTYISKNGFLPTVKRCLQQINYFKSKFINNHLYYVRCDIQDAFGSIKQEKLLDIIKNCCKEHLPVCIRMRHYKKQDKNMRKKSNEKQKDERTVQFLDMKRLTLRNIGEICIAIKPQLVNWFKLISIIKKLLFNKKIKLYGKMYSIKTGVPQGLRLSSIFSEIYYQDMFNKLFSEFENNGLVCRYVDDILYITTEKNYAEQFLKVIRNGITTYNVKFNPNKIQTNVEMPSYKLTKVKYLGKNILI